MPPKAIELEAPKQYEFAYLHSSEAERFSIAVLSTAMEKSFLSVTSVSLVPLERDGR